MSEQPSIGEQFRQMQRDVQTLREKAEDFEHRIKGLEWLARGDREKSELDEVLWEGMTRRQVWAMWLRGLLDTIKHTSDVDNILQDHRREDIEPEARRMCEYLADLLVGGNE